MENIDQSMNRGVLSIDNIPRDIRDTCPTIPLTRAAKRDLYKRIRNARSEGEIPVPAMLLTLSSFTRPIRLMNRISLQNRINEIGYTGQPERAFCVLDEDTGTLTAVAGDHRTLAVLPLNQSVMMYFMKVNLRQENFTLSQIAFTVEQFFKRTQTDADVYDSILQLQKWIQDKEKRGVSSPRQLGMSAYVFDKHGVKFDPKLTQNSTVRDHLKGADGNYTDYNAIVPAGEIGTVLKQRNETKALVMIAYKGYKRFADSPKLNDHLKQNAFVCDQNESHAEIYKRFGAFADSQWKPFLGNMLKQEVGYWNEINILNRNNALQIINLGNVGSGDAGNQGTEKSKLSSSRHSGSEKHLQIQELESRVAQLTQLLRENNIEIPAPESVAVLPGSSISATENQQPVNQAESEPTSPMETDVADHEFLLISATPLERDNYCISKYLGY